MEAMKKKTVGRVLVCLLMCCLIINISPIRADAVTADDLTMISVPGTLVVGSALIALGVLPGEADADFDTVVNNVISSVVFDEYFTDGAMTVGKYLDDDGSQVYAVPVAFLDVLRGWLFDTGVVAYSYSPGFGATIAANEMVQIRDDGTSIYGNADFIFAPMTTEAYPSIDNCVGYAISTTSSFMIYNQSGVAVASNASGFDYNGQKYYYIAWNKNNDLVNPYDAYGEGVGLYEAFYKAIDGEIDLSVYTVSTLDDLTLGTVGSPAVTVADAHSDWAATAISNSYFPLCLTATYADAKLLSQADAQSSDSTYVDTSTDTDIGTDDPDKDVVEIIDYTEQLDIISAYLSQIVDASVLISGFLLFFVVVVLCYFSYKFFRIFF